MERGAQGVWVLGGHWGQVGETQGVWMLGHPWGGAQGVWVLVGQWEHGEKVRVTPRAWGRGTGGVGAGGAPGGFLHQCPCVCPHARVPPLPVSPMVSPPYHPPLGALQGGPIIQEPGQELVELLGCRAPLGIQALSPQAADVIWGHGHGQHLGTPIGTGGEPSGGHRNGHPMDNEGDPSGRQTYSQEPPQCGPNSQPMSTVVGTQYGPNEHHGGHPMYTKWPPWHGPYIHIKATMETWVRIQYTPQSGPYVHPTATMVGTRCSLNDHRCEHSMYTKR